MKKNRRNLFDLCLWKRYTVFEYKDSIMDRKERFRGSAHIAIIRIQELSIPDRQKTGVLSDAAVHVMYAANVLRHMRK